MLIALSWSSTVVEVSPKWHGRTRRHVSVISYSAMIRRLFYACCALVAACALRGQPTLAALTEEPPVAQSPILDETRNRWVSASVGYDYRNQEDQSVAVRASLSNFLLTGIKTTVDEVALVSLGLRSNPSEPTITSFPESMAYLQTQATILALSDKQNVLSVLGAVLRQGYSPSITANPDMESVFQNARSRGPDGGVCGDIHTYLGQAASALGFQACGTHTGVWKEYLGTRWGGWHVVSHFRDPVSGEYYMQNYEEVYATGQKTLQNLVEVSSRILGFTWRSSVNSLPGVAHAYIPRYSRWLWNQVEAQALGSIERPYLALDLTNRNQSFGSQCGWADKHQQFKLFGLASRFEADEGDYAFGTAGASYTLKGTTTFSDGAWIDEIGLCATGYGGLLWFETPILRPSPDQTRLQSVQWNYSTSMFGTHVRGFLRQGDNTADLEGLAMSATGFDTRVEFRPGVTHAFKSVPLSITIQRACDLVNLEHSNHIDVAYDRLGAELTLQPRDRLALRINADGFALGGINKRGGWAARAGAEISLKTQGRGTFSVSGDWGEVIQNSADDPFYDLPSSLYASAGWQMRLNRYSAISIRMSYGEGPTTQPFGTFGVIAPDLNNGSRQIGSVVSLAIEF